MNFTAIDFETAVGHHACAVGIALVEKGEIMETFYSLIQPPGNYYSWQTIKVHGIQPRDTKDAPTFDMIVPKLNRFLQGRTVVAHNASFDRSVLKKSMAYYALNVDELGIEQWDCTLKIYRAMGLRPCNLANCCQKMKIELNHHQALSDAVACAKLYLMK